MKQLTIKDIFDMVNKLWKNGNGMNYQDIMALPIYLGNDDELNGIHNGWCVDFLDRNDKSEDMKDMLEMIDSSYGNTSVKDKGILIS